MGRKVELISNLDWAGMFRTMSERNRYWRGDRGDRLFEKVRYNRCHA